jgi:hypothetical protein
MAWIEELGILKTVRIKKVVVGMDLQEGFLLFPTFLQNSLLLISFLSL